MKGKSNRKDNTPIEEEKLFEELDSGELSSSFIRDQKINYEDFQSNQLEPFLGLDYFFKKKIVELEYIYYLIGDSIYSNEELSVHIYDYGDYKCDTHLELDIMKYLDFEVRKSLKIIKLNVKLLDQAKASFVEYKQHLERELDKISDTYKDYIDKYIGVNEILLSISKNLKLENLQSNSSLFNYDIKFKNYLVPIDHLPRILLRNIYEIAQNHEIIHDGLSEDTFIDIITGVNQVESIVFKCESKAGILFIHSIRKIYLKFRPVDLEKSKIFRSNKGRHITASFYSKEKSRFKDSKFPPNHFVRKIEEVLSNT